MPAAYLSSVSVIPLCVCVCVCGWTASQCVLSCSIGVKSGVIHSKRPVDENAQLLQELKHGQLDIVWNVEKLTEVGAV